MVDGGVGVCDGDGGSGGVGPGELVAGDEGDGEGGGVGLREGRGWFGRGACGGRGVGCGFGSWGLVWRGDGLGRNGVGGGDGGWGADEFDDFLREGVPAVDELEVICEGGFPAGGGLERGTFEDAEGMLGVLGEDFGEVLDGCLNGFGVCAVDGDDSASDCLGWRSWAWRREGRADFGEDFDLVDGGDGHYHCFN